MATEIALAATSPAVPAARSRTVPGAPPTHAERRQQHDTREDDDGYEPQHGMSAASSNATGAIVTMRTIGLAGRERAAYLWTARFVRPSITVTLSLSRLATKIMLLTGSTATAHGPLSAGTVAATVFVRPSITDTLLAWVLTT